MKERVIAAAKKMKREQWIVCGLVGLLLLVIAMPVKEEEQQAAGEETQETVKTVKAQTEEETDIRREYENQLAGALEQVEGVGKVSVAVTMETTVLKIHSHPARRTRKVEKAVRNPCRTRKPPSMSSGKTAARSPTFPRRPTRKSAGCWWWRKAAQIRWLFSRFRRPPWPFFMWKPIKSK